MATTVIRLGLRRSVFVRAYRWARRHEHGVLGSAWRAAAATVAMRRLTITIRSGGGGLA